MLRPIALALAALIAGAVLAQPKPAAKSPRPRSAGSGWAFRPIRSPEVPADLPDVMAKRVRNPLDAFVGQRLTAAGLPFSPEADKPTLIRRVTFDLTGLPPSPSEVDAFVNDATPDAYEKLVDRLLASPAHGERWARHWLDTAHFGETHGYDKDKPRDHAWPYRDYVIRAFNADKPWARFVQEQIAGDVLFPRTRDGVEALGFLAAGPWDLIGHTELPESKDDGAAARHLDRDDYVTATIQTFMSFTAQCAQCHNHFVDPLPQEDYYRLQAVFSAIDRTELPYDRDDAVAEKRHSLDGKLKALGNTPEADAVKAELSKLPPQSLVYAAAVHTGKGNFAGTGANAGKPRPIHMLRRGLVEFKGKEVSPGALSTIPGFSGELKLPADASEGERRAALARWVSDVKNPMSWRSAVNRVWHYHFGRGLSDTPNDFGRNGSSPSHPELLDWLAADFRDHGGSLKRLHKIIVTSTTYRQSSALSKELADADKDNRLLGRMTPRKLEAEAVRDAMLQAAGVLDRTAGGPSFRDFVIEKAEHSPHYEYAKLDPETKATFRRSVYRFTVRSQPQPLMAALDCADPSGFVDRRNKTIAPSQALALWNDDWVLAMSKLAGQRLSAMKLDDAARLQLFWREALGRTPTDAEREQVLKLVASRGWANAARVAFNLNEFHYVD